MAQSQPKVLKYQLILILNLKIEKLIWKPVPPTREIIELCDYRKYLFPIFS
jgi:hypothetical protein